MTLLLLAVAGLHVATYIGFAPLDPARVGPTFGPNGMCFWTTPAERRPEVLRLLAGSAVLGPAAMLVGSRRG